MVEEDPGEGEDEEEGDPVEDTNILKVNPSQFVYDEQTDSVNPINSTAFDKLVESHPSVHKLRRGDKRDEKIAGLKSKVLDTLKVKERRKRDLSAESVKSECPGWDMDETKHREKSTDSRGSVRPRSEDDHSIQVSKKLHHQARPPLKPPKILISE